MVQKGRRRDALAHASALLREDLEERLLGFGTPEATETARGAKRRGGQPVGTNDGMIAEIVEVVDP